MTAPHFLALFAATVLMVLWSRLETRTTLQPGSMRSPVAGAPAPAEPRADADLLQLLRAMHEDCAPLLQRGGLTLRQHFACAALPVFVQQAGIRQLLLHVVTIATHAMRKGGTLDVTARVEGPQAVVHFVDTGADGRGAAMARLFERAESGPRETAPGSVGACAASCQRLATGQGGRIHAGSAPSGELGLTLRLPLCALAPDEPGTKQGTTRP